MNFMKTLSLAMVFALSSPVWPNFIDGKWIGPATLKMEGQAPRTEACSNVEIVFSSKNDSLTVNSYKSNCPSAPSDWGPYTMPIVGNDVYSSDGESIIGSFDGIKLLTRESDGGVLYDFNALISHQLFNKESLEMLSEYAVTNLLGKITIEAHLKKID